MRTTRAFLVRNLAIVILPLLMFGCGPEEPETNGLINTSVSLFSNAALQGKITISQAYIDLTQITLHGTAPTQDVLTFSKSIPADQSRISLLDKTLKPHEITGKINSYDPFTVTLTLARDVFPLAVTSDEAGTSVNFTEFLEKSTPALFIAGKFENRGRPTPLYLAISDVLPLKTIASQYGNPQVQIDLENRAEIQLNTGHIFSGITTQDLENADMIDYQGQEVIFIHPLVNSNLYRRIQEKVQDAGNSVLAKITVTKSVNDQ